MHMPFCFVVAPSQPGTDRDCSYASLEAVMSLRVRLFAVAILGFILIGGYYADQPVRAQSETGETVPSEPSVTVEIFTAFTCPHCRAFSIDTLPRLRAEYADSVRFVMRPIAWDETQRACGGCRRMRPPAGDVVGGLRAVVPPIRVNGYVSQ